MMWEPMATAQWDHTSLIASILINANRKKGSRPVKPEEINPLRKSKPQQAEKRTIKIGKDNWRDLKFICK